MTPSENKVTELTQLREANQSLILAAITAQTMTESAEDTAAKMSFKAEHDLLTGLPNRSLLTDRLEQAMEMARRQGKKVALMFLDLDNFKKINDSFGHEVGDRLLLEVSKRLQECIRHSDTVSRQGGDEFLVLLPVIEALEDPNLIARKLIESMVEPFIVEDHQIKVTLSIGISLFPSDGNDVDSILRNADTAMYQAKEQGRNNYQVFTEDMCLRPERQQPKECETGLEAVLPPANAPVRNPPKPNQQESAPAILTFEERENDILSNERSADLREEAADLREEATVLLGKALQSQEKAADLRQDSADLREDAVTRREKALRPKEEAARAQTELNARTHAQLQEANEHLVIATVEASKLREIAEEATGQVSKMAKLEAHLQEIQKLETLGTLAGGVAHDFNNLLAAIVGNANMGSMVVKTDGDPSPHFEAIEKAAMRASDLTRQLLAYAGKARIEMTEVDLGIVIKEIILLLQISIPSNVALHCDLADQLPLVKGDATQLFQVLMNLITNAGEANLPGVPGSITIRTREEILTETFTGTDKSALHLAPGPYATLEVKDTGTGMPAEVLARVFEPFFTTKFIGRGLGLAAAMGIIRSHGGGIKVESEPGEGSSFKVFLPAINMPGSVKFG